MVDLETKDRPISYGTFDDPKSMLRNRAMPSTQGFSASRECLKLGNTMSSLSLSIES